MEGRVICGFQPAPLGSSPARWPAGKDGVTILYRVGLSGLPGIDRDLFRQVFRSACDAWESVCGVAFREVDRGESLSIITMSQQPGGVLADAELPFWQGRTNPLRMRFDMVEPWAVGSPVPRNRVGLFVVTVHELGHILGLEHGGQDMMRPIYDPGMVIGSWETRLVVDAYGPPRPKPPIPPTPVDPAGERRLAEWLMRNGGLVLRVHESVAVERFS